MRKLLLFLSVVFILSNCTEPSGQKNEKIVSDIIKAERDSFSLLCQYWQLDEADNPSFGDINSKDKNTGIQYESGILFMPDSTVLENPKGNMTYGKFSLNNNIIQVAYDDGRKASYEIARLNKEELHLDRTEKKKETNLYYLSSNTLWPDPSKNPFSKENYSWTKKPSKPEDDAAIRKRAKECVRFYQYYFEGFVNGGAKAINFDALPNPFNWYAGGIFIQKDDKLDNKFINCFYSAEDAFKARKELQNILQQKHDWDTTQTNWLKQTAMVLEQMEKKM
jgi:hypothetical protein